MQRVRLSYPRWACKQQNENLLKRNICSKNTNTFWGWSTYSNTFLLERKPCRYNCGKISFTQGSTCSLWTGSLGKSEERKERRKQRARTSNETGRGWGTGSLVGERAKKTTLDSLRSLIYFRTFPPRRSLFTGWVRETKCPLCECSKDNFGDDTH